MTKLVWDNNRQVPSAKNTQSHSRHYVPSGGSMADTDDRFMRHYRHVFTMGVQTMQQNCKGHYLDEFRKREAANTFDEIMMDFVTE